MIQLISIENVYSNSLDTSLDVATNKYIIILFLLMTRKLFSWFPVKISSCPYIL